MFGSLKKKRDNGEAIKSDNRSRSLKEINKYLLLMIQSAKGVKKVVKNVEKSLKIVKNLLVPICLVHALYQIQKVSCSDFSVK